MAFRDIAKKIKYPQKTSERFKRLDAYDRLREGTFYDHLTVPFEREYDEGGNYISMRTRRPSIIWQGAEMLASQIAGLLWGDEQMPVIRTYLGESPAQQDREAETGIQHLSELLGLDSVMDNVTVMSSSGSCAVILRATDEKEAYIEVVPGKECTPKFDPSNPYKMTMFEQLYPTTGAELVEMGYDVPDKNLRDDYWFRLTIDEHEEVRYKPMLARDYARMGAKNPQGTRVQWVRDEDTSFPHNWGRIPVVWIKAPSKGINRLDGDCLYGKIADALVAIDYDLSQIERGFRYTADPMLAIQRGELPQGAVPVSFKGDSDTKKDEAGNIIKSPTNILDIEPGGEAKLLEISGQGLDKFREFVKTLREWGLEIAGGMKADADSQKGTDSGRALEILYQNMILLLKRWRVAVGNNGYIPLLRMLLEGIENDVIEVKGIQEQISSDTTMRLVWQNWMTPTGQDLQATATAWQTLAGGSARDPVKILPVKTVTRMAAGNLGIVDTSAVIEELDRENEQDSQDELESAQDQADIETDAVIKQQKAKPKQPKLPLN